MKIKINDIEDGKVKFVLVNDEGVESNEISIYSRHFDHVKEMVSLDLHFDDVKNSELFNVIARTRLKKVSEQFIGFALPA